MVFKLVITIVIIKTHCQSWKKQPRDTASFIFNRPSALTTFFKYVYIYIVFISNFLLNEGNNKTQTQGPWWSSLVWEKSSAGTPEQAPTHQWLS